MSIASRGVPHPERWAEPEMKRRRLVFVLLAVACVAGIVGFLLGHWTEGPRERPVQLSAISDRGVRVSAAPKVVLWYDASSYSVRNAVRIDVFDGLPHRRDSETPIDDIPAFVNEAVDRLGEVWVVVTPLKEARMAEVVRVIDECRKSRAHGIVVNEWMGRDPWAEN